MQLFAMNLVHHIQYLSLFGTPPFCRFRMCYLDFALSLDSAVFLIIPLPCSFGILLTIYEVQWNNDVNTYVNFFTLTTSCGAPHYSSITLTRINYRIYKPKARLMNWKKIWPNLFLFFKTIDLEYAITLRLLSLLERGWFCYCVISYD
jgi:hypothetical protein